MNSLSDNKIKWKRKITLFVIILISFLGFVVFLLPILKNIVNLGGIVGCFACAVVFFSALFFTQFEKIIMFFWGKPIGRIALIFLSILIIVGIIMVSVFSVLMLSKMSNTSKKPNVVVVLGCKLNGSTPSLMLENRLNVALKYLKENPDVFCIVTGGQGDNEDIPEAEAMKLYLVKNGIFENRIFVEDKSINTFENLKFAKNILETNDLGQDITIVTDGFHQYRASVLAKELGLKSSAVSAKTKVYLLPTYWVREWFGIVKEIVF